MLFNSYIYIFIFLPVVVCGYFLLNRFQFRVSAKVLLITASLVFYAWWRLLYLPLIVGSIAVNYFLGEAIARKTPPMKKLLLLFGIAGNLSLLGYFKYTGFAVESINSLFTKSLAVPDIVLPLAISFFTFQQIAYLVDSYRSGVNGHSFLNYMLFISFFPQLIAGPIVHHREMMHNLRVMI